MEMTIGFLIGILLSLIVALSSSGGATYRDGQIDCINGKIKFQLIVNPDNSVSWEKIK